MANVIGHIGDRIQESVRQAQNKSDRRSKRYPPFDGDGSWLTSVNIGASTSVEFGHRLGRAPRGWWIMSYKCDGTADGMVREVSSDKELIELQNDATSAVSFDIWIF